MLILDSEAMVKILFILITLLPLKTVAAILTEEQVVASALKHYPQVLAAYENVEAGQGQLRGAYGAFDSKMTSFYELYIKGFYKRRYQDALVEKPLGFMGSKVYAGFSNGKGVFPPMYNMNATNSLGTPRIGFSVSLLRNMLVDAPRTDLANAKLEKMGTEFDSKGVKLNVRKDAIIAYWSWIASIKVYKIYENLLQFALQRDHILQAKVKSGDTPMLAVVENNQYIAKRRSELASADILKNQMAGNLSLFYRDHEGKPILPTDDMALTDFPEAAASTFDHQADYTRALDLRPDLKRMNIELEKTMNDYKLAKNQIWPQFDLSMDYTRNRGCCDPTNASQFYTMMLKFEVPLEYRLIMGRAQEVGANRRALDHNLRLMRETIENEIRKKRIAVSLAREKVGFAKIEQTNAEQLVEAENFKLKKGGSNLFLINIREEFLADAQANYVNSQLEAMGAWADYRTETVSFEELAP